MTPVHEPAATEIAPTSCSAVLFDGSCPLCSREIAMYQRLPATAPIAWIDITSPTYNPPPGITRTALMQRFHVVAPSGDLLSGARAFVHVWSRLPGWRHLARLAQLPLVMPLMEMGYRLFLLIRPWMQSAYRSARKVSQ